MRLEPSCEADVRPLGELQLSHRGGDELGILGLDGDRPGRAGTGRHLRQLGHAVAEAVVDAPLVHGHRGESRARSNHLVHQLLERVGLARELRDRDAERAQHGPEVVGAEREEALEHGTPLLEPVAVDGFEPLHVHQAVADLDGGVALLREQVELVALLHALGLAQVEEPLGGAEALAEGAPLPARDDSGNARGARDSRRSAAQDFSLACSRAKYSSALRVFVSCSPERSTPCSTRKARVSAATWNASFVAARVDSSRMREPSG